MTPDSVWTLEATRKHVLAMLAANDQRYAQRFEQQEKALEKALVTQEKAVNAALTASKEAVTKAEIAQEKRLDSVNEFRGQLNDMVTTLMPRAESEAMHKASDARIEAQMTNLAALLGSFGSRLDKIEGRSGGLNQGWVYLVGFIGAGTAVGALVVAIIG